jgi:hypothetical protein
MTTSIRPLKNGRRLKVGVQILTRVGIIEIDDYNLYWFIILFGHYEILFGHYVSCDKNNEYGHDKHKVSKYHLNIL